jgi:GTPase
MVRNREIIMSELNKVAIVGRPNVGKSALFNRIVGKRIAIVDKQAGITRDRLGADTEWNGVAFRLIDTGGIVIASSEPIIKQVRFQAEVAMAEAAVILLVLDVNDGVTRFDSEVADIIRKAGKPVIIVANKCDRGIEETRIGDLYAFGFSNIFPVSAIHGIGIGDLLDDIVRRLPEGATGDAGESGIKIAVVGKPNVGKSTFINCLLKENRLVVDDAPGTTRDAVDVEYVDETGRHLILVDTAGIKRSRKLQEAVDMYSYLRSQAAIERCDVAILMMDASEGVTTGDLKIAHMINEAGKGCVIAVNKWDTSTEYRKKDFLSYLYEQMPLLSHCPMEFTVASEGINVYETLKTSVKVFEDGLYQLPTSRLNKIIENALDRNQPPLVNRRRLKVYYATQVGTNPPNVLLFVNDRSLMKNPYLNYLINSIRKEHPFSGSPIRIALKNRK